MIATARNMLRVVGLRWAISASVSRENRAGESAWSTGGSLPSRHRDRYLACPRQQFLRRAVHRRSGGAAIRVRSVHTSGNPIIYGVSPLLIVFVASAPSPSSLRIRSPRRSHFSRMMVLQFSAAFFSMPETRGAARERMNERLRMSGRKSSRRNM
jgi:hypothetical protein